MSKRAKRWLAVVIGLVVGACFFNSSLFEKWRFYRFNRDLWLSSEPEQRYYMARYLVDRQMTIGKTEAEIRSLLGPPTPGGPGDFMYKLGLEHGSFFRIDHDWLELSFDDSGRVTDATIRPD